MADQVEDPSRTVYWACCSAGQLAGAGLLYSRGHGATSMPVRAFCIATLLIGSGACATTAAFHAAGFHEIDDFKELGKSIRHHFDTSVKKNGKA